MKAKNNNFKINYMTIKKPIIWIALSSWSARGISHIWVLEGLKEIGIEPDIVCWTSMWSIVWAAYVNNNLEKLKKTFSSLSRYQVLKFFNVWLSKSSIIDREKFKQFFIESVCAEGQNIQDLPKKYWCVATSFDTGKEVSFLKDNLLKSIFSSSALPWLFAPYYYNDEFFIDGGVVNPVPVSLCKKLWADIVIAVDLNSILLAQKIEKLEKNHTLSNYFIKNNLLNKIKEKFNLNVSADNSIKYPSMMETSLKTIDIMQCRITKHRFVDDAADIILEPQVAQIWVLDFYKFKEAIDEWKKTVEKNKEKILKCIKNYKKESK